MRRAITHLSTNDPILAEVIRQVGPCRIAYREPTFDTLARSIVYQQVSTKTAATVVGRLRTLLGDPERLDPFAILALDLAALRSVGLSGQKATYLRNLAEQVQSGELDFAKLPYLSDDRVIRKLTAVKGIGVWTAHMFLIFGLRRPNVLPIGDLGVRAGVRKAYQLEQLPSPAEVTAIAASWHPWCSVACWYMWRHLDGTATLA